MTSGAAGLAKPDLSILSEELLAEVRGRPQRNLDKPEKATETVLQQAEVLLKHWAAEA